MAELRIKELLKFNPDTYRRLLNYLQRHYRLVPFREIPKEDVPYVILRHDVDVSVLQALKIAEIEHEMGVRATYFILVSSKHYNSLEGDNASTIRNIAELGHEIGLHYDSAQYGSYERDSDEAVKFEAGILERLSNQKVTATSCHAPKGPKSFVRVKGYVDADDPRLRDVYVHDSQRIWTIRSLSVLLSQTPKRVLLNTHPTIWTGGQSRKTKLDAALLDVLSLLYRIRAIAMRLIHSQEVCPS